MEQILGGRRPNFGARALVRIAGDHRPSMVRRSMIAWYAESRKAVPRLALVDVEVARRCVPRVLQTDMQRPVTATQKQPQSNLIAETVSMTPPFGIVHGVLNRRCRGTTSRGFRNVEVHMVQDPEPRRAASLRPQHIAAVALPFRSRSLHARRHENSQGRREQSHQSSNATRSSSMPTQNSSSCRTAARVITSRLLFQSLHSHPTHLRGLFSAPVAPSRSSRGFPPRHTASLATAPPLSLGSAGQAAVRAFGPYNLAQEN